jgi:hypothetical protein
MNCILCSQPATQGVSLSNGRILHSECFQRLTSEYSIVESRATSARSEAERVQLDLIAQSGFFQKVASFFGGRVSSEQLRIRLEVCNEKAEEAERAFAEVQRQATPVFDILLDYPPDWEGRRELVRARDGSCVACGSGHSLQAHHITPLSRGGTNRIENLKLLCEKCHRAEHGGRQFTHAPSNEPLPFAERVQVIEGAIADRRDIEFLYRKPTDSSKMKRRVTPHELIEMNHEHSDGMTLCLQGYCHSRHAIRVFALKRMTAVRRV